MIEVVTADNRVLFEAQLKQMFEQRYDVFVEQFGWDLPAKGAPDRLEKDMYDNDRTIYLVAMDDEDGSVTGAMRLIPTEGPHLMRDHFDHLCEGEIPQGQGIWESSRTYVWMPEASNRKRLRAGLELQCAMTELSLLYGIDRVSFVCTTSFLSVLLGAGLQVTPLGLPAMDGDNEPIVACAFEISAVGLENVKRMVGIREGSSINIEALPKVA